MKDHEIAELVNRLTSISREFHGHQSLRAMISKNIVPALKAGQGLSHNLGVIESELKQINETEVSVQAWDRISLALEFAE